MNKLMLYIGTFLMQRVGNVFHHKERIFSHFLLQSVLANVSKDRLRLVESESLAIEVLQSILHGKGNRPLPRTIMLHIQETDDVNLRNGESQWKIECYGEEVTTVEIRQLDRVGEDRHGRHQYFIITDPIEFTPPTG